jgi:hypothetical protein
MRLMPMDSDDSSVLPAIPMNITDIALAAVSKKLGNVTRTAPTSGNTETNNVQSQPPNGMIQPCSEKAHFSQTVAKPQPTVVHQIEKPKFFKDAAGNEYRMKNGKLYIKGWSDTNLKFRLLNATTGKELSLDNKKIQIYGWHVVETVTEDSEIKNEENSNVDEIETVEEETKNE